ncbi:DUF983 domain-containing protein [Segetibacter sp. 3557_3]|uniref:DUF983 domain-containing protein n=1 Tax=Segetibacter sp. 3557_3 TaxID=2547429 RepID=UPI0010587FB3|nr:DUF983 domain-containing protein [Segetibacter sp. 3557_3]TDH21646.1 DUF983 domain-containing protein [Segetibacter sp. 3557_3]
MNFTEPAEKRSPLKLLACKCPRCREGDMFEDKNPWHLKNTMKMYPQCPICKQPFDIEVGFYFGSSYVSYAFTVALSVATFIAWWVIIGFSINDNRIFYWLTFNALLLIAMQPYLMRVARTGWLAFLVKYDRNWKNNQPKPVERNNRDQQNNW